MLLAEIIPGSIASPDWFAGATVLFALLIGHALADYPLQGAFLATAKNRHSDSGALFNEENAPKGLWIHALTAHALVHAGAVWAITGVMWLALVELVLHWFIDFAKCEGWTGFTTDQILHLVCKIGYSGVIALGYATLSGIVPSP